MQLTIDSLLNDGFNQVENNHQQDKGYKKWRLFDYLETLGINSATAAVTYQDDFLKFRVPIQIEGIAITNDKNDVRLSRIYSDNSVVHLSRVINLTIVNQGEQHFASYLVEKSQSITGANQKSSSQFIDSKGRSSFTIQYYPIKKATLPKFTENVDFPEITSKLIGSTVRFKVKPFEDWIREIKTIPFTITSIERKGSQLRIEGEDDYYLQVVGFQGIRVSGNNLLFDVYNSIGGYTRTFYIGSDLKQLL